MPTKTAMSITIAKHNLGFLEKIVKNNFTSKSEFIDSLINKYRKYYIKKEMIEGFQSQTKEDLEETMSDFGDYLGIIERGEDL